MLTYRVLGKLGATLLIGILCLSFSACSTGQVPDTPPFEPPDDTQPDSPSEQTLPPVMGVALDPSGVTIPLASVGEEVGDFNGVISGDLERSSTGWLTVEAIGYATTYAHTFGEFNGVDVFEARLTPFSVGTTLTDGTSETLKTLDEDQLKIETTMDSALFSDLPATVMMTVIDRLDIASSYQDVDDRNDLNLHYAFAVQAFDANWKEIPLAAGASINAQLVIPRAFSTDLILAAFDPITGTWSSIPGACHPIDSTVYDCSLDRFSALFGLFHETAIVRDELVLTENSMSASNSGGGALMTIPYSDRYLEGSWDTQFKIAWDKISEWINSREWQLWTLDPDETYGLDDPELLDLIDDLIDVALKFAAENRNEAGKLHLVKAGEAANYFSDKLGAPAINEAAHIAYEMGVEILKDPDCGKFQEAFKIAENNILLAGSAEGVNNEQMANNIIDTYEEIIKDCDVWRGSITLRLPTWSMHPVEDFSHRFGSSEWLELHQIQISTNVKTFASRAEDHVTLMFSPVTYAAVNIECPNNITYSSSQPGRLFLTARGSFDGYGFVFDNLTPRLDSSPGTITQRWNFQSKYGDPPTCQADPGGQASIPLGFYSLLAHGFLGETPSITLQEMLDSWEVGSDVIQGSREIENPEPDTSNIPVPGGSVLWNLHHDQAKLPLPE